MQLGLKPNYDVKDNPLNWLDDVLGVEHQNFFEGRVSSYSRSGVGNSNLNMNFSTSDDF